MVKVFCNHCRQWIPQVKNVFLAVLCGICILLGFSIGYGR